MSMLLRKDYTRENNLMQFSVKGEGSPLWVVDLYCCGGVAENEEDWHDFVSLTKSFALRINNICKVASENFDSEDEVLEDGKLSCFMGNCSAKSEIKDGILLFDLDFDFIGGAGVASFKLGKATKERVDKVNSLTHRLYDFLPSFTYYIKHRYIDTYLSTTDFEEDDE